MHGRRARAAQRVDGGVEQSRPVPGAPGLGCTPNAVSSPVSGEASGSWLGPMAAKPTTWSPAHATSSRYTPGGGSPASGARRSRSRRLERRRAPRRARTRHTPRATRPTAPGPRRGRRSHGRRARWRRPAGPAAVRGRGRGGRRGDGRARVVLVRGMGAAILSSDPPNGHVDCTNCQKSVTRPHTGWHVRQRLRRTDARLRPLRRPDEPLNAAESGLFDELIDAEQRIEPRDADARRLPRRP